MKQFDAILRGLGLSSVFFFIGRVAYLFGETRDLRASIVDGFATTFAMLIPIMGLLFLIWRLAASLEVRMMVWHGLVFGAVLSVFLSWFWTRYFVPLPWERSLWAEAFCGACLALVTWYGSFGWRGRVHLTLRSTDGEG